FQSMRAFFKQYVPTSDAVGHQTPPLPIDELEKYTRPEQKKPTKSKEAGANSSLKKESIILAATTNVESGSKDESMTRRSKRERGPPKRLNVNFKNEKYNDS
ncbi:hypothetical protein PENTCL1PPCAC_10237, partial [Pristionchus entomophagus]